MHPTLFHLGPLTVHTYGVMITVAFIVAIFVADKRAQAIGLSRNFALDISFLILIFSLACARLTYVVLHWDEFADHPWDIISPIQHNGTIGIAGLVLLGGVVGGVLTAVVYVRIKKMSLPIVLDILVPSLAIGIAIGRIGCFMNGCCFGCPTSLPWGCVFSEESLAGYIYPHTHIHPTQLYDSALMVIIFILLLRYDKRAHPQGRTFALFLMTYGIARCWVEGIRWYEPEMVAGFIGPVRITFSRIVSVLLLLVGVVLWNAWRRKVIQIVREEA
jgi:phosphatidylglycerol:prolipoprotein diacylglycerol transferase